MRRWTDVREMWRVEGEQVSYNERGAAVVLLMEWQICAGCDTARRGYLQASFYISELRKSTVSKSHTQVCKVK